MANTILDFRFSRVTSVAYSQPVCIQWLHETYRQYVSLMLGLWAVRVDRRRVSVYADLRKLLRGCQGTPTEPGSHFYLTLRRHSIQGFFCGFTAQSPSIVTVTTLLHFAHRNWYWHMIGSTHVFLA